MYLNHGLWTTVECVWDRSGLSVYFLTEGRNKCNKNHWEFDVHLTGRNYVTATVLFTGNNSPHLLQNRRWEHRRWEHRPDPKWYTWSCKNQTKQKCMWRSSLSAASEEFSSSQADGVGAPRWVMDGRTWRLRHGPFVPDLLPIVAAPEPDCDLIFPGYGDGLLLKWTKRRRTFKNTEDQICG